MLDEPFAGVTDDFVPFITERLEEIVGDPAPSDARERPCARKKHREKEDSIGEKNETSVPAR